MYKRTVGFRFSKTDAVFLSLCALFAWGMRPWLFEFSWLALVAAGHFFLFCNIFRLRRKFELWWSAYFLVNFLTHVYADAFGWPRVLMVQAPATLLAIGLEMRSARYHGVLAHKINATHLEGWLAGRID
ncbi:MAG: hypothetical protein ACI841_003687 [Planctomycetota bacterium]|jgi:hypothetical protein